MDHFALLVKFLNDNKDRHDMRLKCELGTDFHKTVIICHWAISLEEQNCNIRCASRFRIMVDNQSMIEAEAKTLNDIMRQISFRAVHIIYQETGIDEKLDMYICKLLDMVRIETLQIEFNARGTVLQLFPRNDFVKRLWITAPYDELELNREFVSLIKFMYENIECSFTFRNANHTAKIAGEISGANVKVTSFTIPAGSLDDTYMAE